MSSVARIARGLPAGVLFALVLLGAAASAVAETDPLATAIALEPPAPVPRWGLAVRAGSFGVPDFIVDEIFVQHPGIEGLALGAELRYYGVEGRGSATALGIAVDHARCDAHGTWQQDEGDKVYEDTGGDLVLTAVTVTQYWNLLPSWAVHPYLGVGLGLGYVEADYHDDDERVTAELWIPAVHVPVGVAAEFGGRFQFAAEFRFLDGFSTGAALLARF